MKIEEKQIKFLSSLIQQKYFTITKPLEEIIEKEPQFISNFLAMIFLRRPFYLELNLLLKNYPFLKVGECYNSIDIKSGEYYDKKKKEFVKDPEELNIMVKKYKNILNRHFAEGKDRNHKKLLDLMRRLETKNCCPIWDRCPGLPDANFGVGGCEGFVWCSVYNLGGSHGSLGYTGKLSNELRQQGYQYLSDIPKELRRKLMLNYLKEYLKNSKK